jgi:uncharacterized membrane protein
MEMETSSDRGHALVKGLGVFSLGLGLGLGLAELAAPRAIQRLIGIDKCERNNVIVRALGAREIAHGVGIFARPRSVWTRLIGDVIDVAFVGLALADDDNDRTRLVPALGALLGVGALDALAAIRVMRGKLGAPIVAAMTINKSPDEVYARWRDFERLPEFMRYLDSVTVLDDRRSRWIAKTPAGELAWDAEITEDVPGRTIAWRSTTKAIPMRGRVTFNAAPQGRGTELILEMQVPAFAKLFTQPEITGDLRRFKQVVELGEIVVSDASSVRGLHAGQPSPEGRVR